MIQRHEWEMSISHEDFYRLLPKALKNVDYEVMYPDADLSQPLQDYSEAQINGHYASGNIQIIPGSEHKRKIASLELPVLHLIFIFTDISSKDITQFFADFGRAYQRGGG